MPVDAPEGTAALYTPNEVSMSTSTVGRPRESNICLALIFLMEVSYIFFNQILVWLAIVKILIL